MQYIENATESIAYVIKFVITHAEQHKKSNNEAPICISKQDVLDYIKKTRTHPFFRFLKTAETDSVLKSAKYIYKENL